MPKCVRVKAGLPVSNSDGHFGMALSTAVLIAVTIKSAYLSESLVDRCPEKSADPSASSSVDSNTSRSVWSNLYLMWLVDEFLCGGGGGGIN